MLASLTTASYQDYDSGTNQALEFIATAPWALDAGIAWKDHGGIFLDSSWRHKNENAAPLTFLVTMDDKGKTVPSEL